jgi:DNA mismatch endonuclease (patch repair protein)
MDTLTAEERSARMSLVRSRGNRSTEWRFRSAIVRAGIRGWRMHAKTLPGAPDFVFEREKIIVFIDGCFWHRCPTCRRTLPSTNRAYWSSKIAGNVSRAARINRQLRNLGFRVVRIWEHDLRSRSSVTALLTEIVAMRANTRRRSHYTELRLKTTLRRTRSPRD